MDVPLNELDTLETLGSIAVLPSKGHFQLSGPFSLLAARFVHSMDIPWFIASCFIHPLLHTRMTGFSGFSTFSILIIIVH